MILAEYINASRKKLLTVFTVTFCLLACLLFVSRQSQSTFDGGKVIDRVAFVPRFPHKFFDCSDLFSARTDAHKFVMSKEYKSRSAEFKLAVNQSIVNESIEGFTYQQPTEYRALHYLASLPEIRHVCETGFNLGHSSFNFLTANSKTTVHSFDLGEHQYAHKMATVISRMFPGRHFIHFGDSTKTIPKFIGDNPDFECDLMYIDGGHTYDVAKADLLNLASVANTRINNIIIFDDYPTLKAFDRHFGWAWEDMRRWGFVDEYMRCSFEGKQYQRGFVLGTVVKRP